MEPITIAAIAGGAYLLLRKGAGTKSLSVEQLAAMYVGKSFEGTPLDVRRRFQQEAVRVGTIGKEGSIVWPMSAAENASLPADWAYLLGRVPDFSLGDLGDGSNPWGPGAVWRRIPIRQKQSVIGSVVGAIGSLAGGVVRNYTGVKL